MFLSEDGDRAIGIEDVARRCLRHHRSGVVCVGKSREAFGNGGIRAARKNASPSFAVGIQKNGVIDGLAGFLRRHDRTDAIGGDAHDDGALALQLAPVGDGERHADHGRIIFPAAEAGGADDTVLAGFDAVEQLLDRGVLRFRHAGQEVFPLGHGVDNETALVDHIDVADAGVAPDAGDGGVDGGMANGIKQSQTFAVEGGALLLGDALAAERLEDRIPFRRHDRGHRLQRLRDRGILRQFGNALFDTQSIGVKLFGLVACNRFEPDFAGVDQARLAHFVGQ
ncbi:hypothetical protein D3C71_914840 [compost metagenome]